MSTRSQMRRAALVLPSVAVLIAGPLGRPAIAAPDAADVVGISPRDVFEVVGNSLRNPDSDTSPDTALFTRTGIAMEASPGRFVTWGEWSGASATSTMRTTGGPDGPRTDVRITFSGLIPGGVYSVFYTTLMPDSTQPLCAAIERSLPLDAFHPERQVPERNAFVAGSDGAAEFRGQAAGALLEAQQVALTAVFHLTDTTYYPFPNLGEQQTQGENCRHSYGEDSMRQLHILQKW